MVRSLAQIQTESGLINLSAYTDTVRRSHIRERHRALQGTLSGLPGGAPDEHAPATDAEKEALRRR
jgi:N-acyl-phosphatidylethanolamine-hydrolysing phospholipase D